MSKLSERYRTKALLSEQFARSAPDTNTKDAWTEIAIEWHVLAMKTAVEANDLKIS